MVPVTEVDDREQPDLKLVIHRLVHQLIEQEQVRPGWYDNPLTTSWIGLALQAHDDHEDEISNIAGELEEWFGDATISNEFEVAALGLMGEFFKQYDRGRRAYEEIEDRFFEKLDEEKERREDTDESEESPKFQFFSAHSYLYCALRGVKAYERLDDYRSFFWDEVEAQRERTWTEYNRMAFVETVALEVTEYDPDECRDVLGKMRRVDHENLSDYELIPLVWFFQNQQDALKRALPDEQFAHEFIDEVRQKLWRRLWSELPFERYLSDDIDYGFTPDIQQLALLDQLLGRLDNPIHVFSQEQLEEHEEEIAEEKDEAIRVNQIRKLWGYIGMSLLVGFILVDVIISYPPPIEQISSFWFVEAIIVSLLMHIEWRLEDLSRAYGLVDRYPIVRDFVESIEERNWPAWLLRSVFGIISGLIVAYLWPSIQVFFLAF